VFDITILEVMAKLCILMYLLKISTDS
jgi:hypothetical protein